MNKPGLPLVGLLLLGTALVVTNQPFASWIVALMILGFSAVLYRTYHTRLTALLVDLATLRGLVNAPGDPDVLEHIEVPSGLEVAWQAYRAGLLPDPRDGRRCSRAGASEVFTQATLLEPRLNIGLFHAIPSLLVGIGIFFTFLGLAAALAYAAKGVTSTDLAVTQNALKNLFDAASFKFITSIAALGSSVLFTMGEKRTMHQLALELEATCRALDQRFPPLRFEEALLEATLRPASGPSLEAAARAIEGVAAGMSAQMAAVTASRDAISPDAIGRHVGQALHGLFEEQLMPVFGGIRTELESLRAIKQDQGQATLALLMSELRLEVMEPIAARLDQSAALVRVSSEAVTALSKDLAGVTRQFKATTKVIEGFQGQTLERLEGFASTLAEILAVFNQDTRGVLEGVASEVRHALEESIRGLSAQREAFEASAQQTVGTFKQIRSELHASVEGTTLAHQVMLDGVQGQMAGILHEANATFEGATQAMELLMATSVQALDTQRDAFREGAQDTAVTFKDIRRELEQTLKTQAELEAHMLRALQTRTTEFVDRIEGTLGRQMDTLQGIGEQAASLMDGARENLIGSLDTIQAGLGQTRTAAQGELEAFRLQYQAALQDFFARQNQLLEGTLGEQREGLSSTVTALERVLLEETTRRGALSAEGDRSLNAVREAMVDLHRYAGGIGLYSGERIEQLQQLAGQTSGQVEAVERSYETLVERLDEAMQQSNQQLSRYLEMAEGRQGQFFESYDVAVSKLYDKLLQAANYLVEADRHRRDLTSH